jgi:ferritin heavy chain
MNCNLENWSKECEQILNIQINLEYWASLQYHFMASYFDRSEIGLNNIVEFFKKASLEEREHADKLMSYQNKRGGNVILNGVNNLTLKFLETSKKKKNNDVLNSFKQALEMEQKVYQNLLKVHEVGSLSSDPQFCDFIESEYLEEQVNSINELSKYVSQLQLIGDDGHGVWNFDQNLNI